MLILQCPYLETIFGIFIWKNFNKKSQGRAVSNFWMLIFPGLFSGNPNFQGILNWMLQILYYYCRKQHKNIKNSQIIEQNLVLFFPSLCLLWFVLPVTFLKGRIFSFLEQSTLQILNVTSDHCCCIYIVSFSGLKMIFTKFSQLDITACTKNCVYNNFNLCCYFMSSIIEHLQSLFCKYFCTNI